MPPLLGRLIRSNQKLGYEAMFQAAVGALRKLAADPQFVGTSMLGLVAVLLFIAVAGSFKTMMVAQFTDSMVGHIQVHRRGYVGAMESLPVDRNMRPRMLVKLYQSLDETDEIEAWSPRIKLMAMFSNFASTTSIRLNGVYPDREVATVPQVTQRVFEGGTASPLVERGKIQVPELIANGMKIKVGDTVVLVATNKDGSVNGKTFVVQGILESISGPGGRDGYIHIDDARELLRIEEQAVSLAWLVVREGGRTLPDALAEVRADGALGDEHGLDAQTVQDPHRGPRDVDGFDDLREQRHRLLETGGALYEMRPDAAEERALFTEAQLEENGMEFGLHAKTVVFDRHVTFVGSFNLDPRSINLNTEMGLLVESEELAEQVAASIESSMSEALPNKRDAVLTVFGERGVLTAENPVAPHDGHELAVETADGRRVETVAGKTTYFHQLQHVASVITGDARPITGGSDAVNTMRVLDEVYRKAGRE